MTYAISTAVEAGSLSSITPIASNPPAHPGVRATHLDQPLTLYIARVPGSRDVFLTPLKPREKIVSAQDVQSSLYYVHFNTDVDTAAMQQQQASSVNTNAGELLSIQEDPLRRKPVPPPRSPLRKSPSPVGRAPHPAGSQAPNSTLNPPNRTKSQIARKPVASSTANDSSLHSPTLDLPELPRRPLPPPPAEDEGYGSSLTVNEAPTKRHWRHSASDNIVTLPEPGSLTIIRRDPATSAQWNVASVRDPPAQEVSSAALLSPIAGGKAKKGGAPMWLEITNPGYQQYISSHRSESRTSTSTSSSENDIPPEGTFRRRLYLPGSRYPDRRWTQKPTYLPTPANAIPSDMRRQDSAESSPYPDLNPPLMDRRSAGYSFFSPWDGRCDFSTSKSGRALKCLHHLPNNQGSVEVSELRFNLPTTQRQPAAPTSVAEKRGSYFHGLHRRLKSDDSWGGGPSPEGDQELPTYLVDEDGKLDLSLGQERAGGGFGGKQAKLGKLIVHPDGVAMLDLLVAANVGLWWRAWERV
ncbi:hypothetical protein WHR41_00636 [Cladosporium halotolerans]|uniref:Oxidoreductase-like protein n=1 Tax=Cladosporium halotolerans TaxID=1052096 RepID=A0AB34L404_9PEZI